MCKSTSKGAISASGFLGAVMGNRAGSHSQGLPHHTPVRKRAARGQVVPPRREHQAHPWGGGQDMDRAGHQPSGGLSSAFK